MTTKALTINPTKFTIYDSDLSDYSDADVDPEEWVSVSSSSTLSTTSTLPQHLVLRPKITTAPPPPPPPPPTASTRYGCNILLAKIKTSTISSSIVTLRSHIPTLTSIYIVSPQSLRHSPPSCTVSPTPTTACLPIHTHRPVPNETYLRVCVDCARPSLRIFCNGTWSSSPAQTCQIHCAAVQKLHAIRARCGTTNGTYGSGSGGSGGSSGVQAGSCGRADCCDGVRDREVLDAVLDAVKPFGRAEVEASGVKVFDVCVPPGAEVYVHMANCAC